MMSPNTPSSLHEKRPLLEPKTKGQSRWGWRKSTQEEHYVLVIHGGAGTMSRFRSTPELRVKYKTALSGALQAGYAVLKDGGEAMDATVAAVSYMEDCPLFNSGKGAVFNTGGKNELESSIMLSKPPSTHPEIPSSRRGFGLTLLTHTHNPSQLARALYLDPKAAPHTFLSGATAEDIGKDHGLEPVDESYFFTAARWREHRRGLGLPEEPFPYPGDTDDTLPLDQLPTGTVGAVALDVRGCIAAVTSTGGRTNKLVGRIGDTPSMGSGFWAEEWSVQGKFRQFWRKVRGKSTKVAMGVSGTGDGDYFIRLNTASTMANLMKNNNESVEDAAITCVDMLRVDGGVGGVIALDDQGHVAMSLNCSGMYRGLIKEDGQPLTAIFDDDELD